VFASANWRDRSRTVWTRYRPLRLTSTRITRAAEVSLFLWMTSAAFATPCDAKPVLTAGTRWSTTWTDAKGKPQGAITSEARGGAPAVVHTESSDHKARPLSKNDYDILCAEDGTLSYDVRALLPPGMVAAYATYTLTVDGTRLEYPAAMVAGQTLPDARLTASWKFDTKYQPPGGQLRPNVSLEIVLQKRTVVGQESVTTPAGTFDAFKITQEVATKSVSYEEAARLWVDTEWFVPGMGVVRTESRTTGGKMKDWAELTAWTAPPAP
jgi:hypothetical protein